MEILLALVLLAAVFAVLAYPLYQSRPPLEFAPAGTLNDLLAQRDGVYATLRDLDLDYQLGKLDAVDYQALREKYLARASVLLQQLDALRGVDTAHRDLSDEIEREVAVLRQQAPGGGDREKQKAAPGPAFGVQGRRPSAEGRPQKTDSGRPAVVHRLQATAQEPAAANGNGTTSAIAVTADEEEEAVFCTNCGRKRKPGERYCAKCGQALS